MWLYLKVHLWFGTNVCCEIRASCQTCIDTIFALCLLINLSILIKRVVGKIFAKTGKLTPKYESDPPRARPGGPPRLRGVSECSWKNERKNPTSLVRSRNWKLTIIQQAAQWPPTSSPFCNNRTWLPAYLRMSYVSRLRKVSSAELCLRPGSQGAKNKYHSLLTLLMVNSGEPDYELNILHQLVTGMEASGKI